MGGGSGREIRDQSGLTDEDRTVYGTREVVSPETHTHTGEFHLTRNHVYGEQRETN